MLARRNVAKDEGIMGIPHKALQPQTRLCSAKPASLSACEDPYKYDTAEVNNVGANLFVSGPADLFLSLLQQSNEVSLLWRTTMYVYARTHHVGG